MHCLEEIELKRNPMNLYKIPVLLTCLFSAATYATTEAEYTNFFNKYQALGHNFDVSFTKLYSDEANITVIRKMPDGINKTLNIKGKKWKEMITDSIEFAKQRGDKSEFSNVNIKVNDNRAKITANRYSTIKCFNDNNYSLAIEKGIDNKLQIVEEFIESPLQSSCTDKKNDIPLLLQGVVKVTNKQLPVMVDSDTRLDKVSSESSTLIFHYTYIKLLSTEFDVAVLEQNLRPLFNQRSCTKPNLKPIIKQGASISYRFSGKDKKQILTIDVNANSCSQLNNSGKES